MNKSHWITTIALLTALALPGQAGAMAQEHDAMPAGMQMHGMKHMFLQKKEIDGYTVSFHVMPATEGMQHGGTHNFMIKVEKDGKPAKIIAINSKVVHPDKQAESKMMMPMGDWYMTGYDLGQAGRSQLMVLFKTEDGTKHFGGVYYPGSQ